MEKLGEGLLQHGRARSWKETNATRDESTVGKCQKISRPAIIVLVTLFSRGDGDIPGETSAKYHRAKTVHLSQVIAMALVLVWCDGQYPHDDLRLNKVMTTEIMSFSVCICADLHLR
jgi:hypothetical protein